MLHSSIHKTPIGSLYLIANGETLLGAGFRSYNDLLKRMNLNIPKNGIKEVKYIPKISNLISNYFDGDLMAINLIRTEQAGSEFSLAIWKALRKIPSGKTWSYSELARNARRPNAVRAAGTACGKNLIAPIVPCHRVIKSDGEIGNYGYGSKIKLWLLRHEGAL